MESFFGTLKTELVRGRRYATREEARRDLFADIEGYYNRLRLHSALGYIAPEQAELRAAQPGVHFFRARSPCPEKVDILASPERKSRP